MAKPSVVHILQLDKLRALNFEAILECFTVEVATREVKSAQMVHRRRDVEGHNFAQLFGLERVLFPDIADPEAEHLTRPWHKSADVTRPQSDLGV